MPPFTHNSCTQDGEIDQTRKLITRGAIKNEAEIKMHSYYPCPVWCKARNIHIKVLFRQLDAPYKNFYYSGTGVSGVTNLDRGR